MSDWPRAFCLTEQQWLRLAKIVALPAQARPELQNILGVGLFLAELDANEIAPSATKKRLVALRKRLDDLLIEMSAPDVRMCLIEATEAVSVPPGSFVPPRLLTASNEFDNCLERLHSLALWFSRAEGGIVKGETGNKTSGPRKIAREVKELLERHTSFRLTTGEKANDPAKDFLSACFELAGIGVTADAVIRGLAADRRRKVSAEKEQKP